MADESEVQNVENAAPAEDAPPAEAEAKVAETTSTEAKNDGGAAEVEPEAPVTDTANKEAAANDAVDTDAPRLNKNSLPIRAYLDQTVVPVLLQVRPFI